MASNSDGGGSSNGTLSRNFATRDYDALKQQYEKTSNELSSSRRRCDHHLTDLDYYREQHRAVMNQLEVSSQDSATLRTKYTELLNDNKQLQQDNQRLLKELSEQNGNASDALFMSHTQALSKLEVAQEENARLAKQCEVLDQERGVAQRDVMALKQKLVKLYKDYSKYKEAHQKLQQQYEEAVNVTIKANKDIKRLTDERNATMAEYTLIMSERDTVHKEMEKLSDDLAQAVKKLKLLDANNKDLQEEKRNLNYQLESLRREIVSALSERDKAIKECNDLREKFGEFNATSEDGRLGDQTSKSRGRLMDSVGALGEGGGRKDNLREDARSINQRQRLDNLDQANQELESLRKSLDKTQTELAEAIQEAEVSKGRRDWAFSERDKIVLERESIRSLCDNMRKERDRAVSELAVSLRESDAVKKQRNELLKEVKSLSETLETHLEREQQHEEFGCCGHTETEVVELELPGGADDGGLELAGGFAGDGSVYVANVAHGSAASGILYPRDKILRVNDVDYSQGSLRMVTEAIRSSVPVARVLIKRTICARNDGRATGEQVTKWIHTASLAPGCHGLSLRMGVYINRISEGSLAARDKSLTVGDRILKINDKSMDEVESALEAMQVLDDSSVDVINITTLKMSYPECPNVFTPVRRYNQCSQTDDWLLISPLTSSNSSDYNKYASPEKNTNSGAWLKEKLDIMRGRRPDKKKYRNSSPNPIQLQPEEAIAELDWVLDSYHQGAGTIKRGSGTKRHQLQSKDEKNNGGTWPKARAAEILQSAGGTVVARCKKERPPLSLPKESPEYYRNSTPVSRTAMSGIQPTSNRHSLYKSVDATHHFGTPTDSFERLRATNNGNVGNRLSVNMNSDNSLDFPVHRFVDKAESNFSYKKTRSGIAKYSSDSERESILGGIHPELLPSHSRGHSHLFATARVQYPFHPHPHNNHSSRESFSFEPFHHRHSPSVDVGGARRAPDPIEGGTFPRKREQRFRVPSNPSVTSKVSTGSIERGSSERGSPMPIFHVEVLSSPGDHSGTSLKSSNSKEGYPWTHKPLPGELRRVHIDKSNEPLGIQINCPETGGIFVSTVSDNSLASRVGLQIGDQLLEVCGINMRKATYNLAANVLRQCGNSITMLVQYSPDKYSDLERGSCSGSMSNDDEDEDEDDEGESEATPCNSPKEIRKTPSLQMKPSALSVLQRQPNITATSTRSTTEEPRYLSIETLKTSNLGISLVGGNAAGIFIHSVHPESLAYHAGLRTGDQILEYNGSDLRSATAEEAAYELAKPAEKVTVFAHYRIDKYNEIKDKPGDSLYVRCGFDRSGNEMTEPPQLAFAKGDVLYVDNTMFNGVPGQWRAWRLDDEGHRQQCGVIPSKYKVEEELLLRRGAVDTEGRTATTARRSFFRRKKHQRGGSAGLGSSSRDSKELASFCNLSPGWYSDSGSLHEDLSQSSYQRVERLQYPEFQPVLILGPLAECVADKLVTDFPEKFHRPATETRGCAQALLDRELAEGLVVEYRRRGSCYECTTVAAVRAVTQNRLHCMLDGSIAIVERLHRHRIYPVVLLIKFKSTKQIKEVKDARYSLDKLSGKAAKEMFEHGMKLEVEYRNLVTAVVSAGANVAHVCAQVEAAIDAEHRKSQWVPVH